MKCDMNSILKWVATVITLAGSLCVALSIDPLNVILLNLGSFLFLILACRIKDKAMITVNFGLLAIYISGLYLRVV